MIHELPSCLVPPGSPGSGKHVSFSPSPIIYTAAFPDDSDNEDDDSRIDDFDSDDDEDFDDWETENNSNNSPNSGSLSFPSLFILIVSIFISLVSSARVNGLKSVLTNVNEMASIISVPTILCVSLFPKCDDQLVRNI